MRHKKAGKELGRTSSHRRAMLRNMATSLFKYEQIETTDAKAKALRPVAEKMITLAKRGDLHARRQALAYLQDKAVTHRLFDELKDRFTERQGGYLRIVKKNTRRGDGAPVSIVQFVIDEGSGKPGKKGKKAKKAAKSAPKTKKEQSAEKKKAVKADAEKTPDAKQGSAEAPPSAEVVGAEPVAGTGDDEKSVPEENAASTPGTDDGGPDEKKDA
ncbi:MAG: 50S ribosomal protein L17 [Deltaproteobacteria bacterium]|nr:50S ribosomal protein L17 [Deltaproteobacteria bacterium]MBW1816424.1 50S ribosomal protein L17 [Deltaproteobacteria bacterium]